MMRFVTREADGTTCCTLDRHTLGVFPREFWLESLGSAGFQVRGVEDSFRRIVFAGRAAAVS